MAGDDTGGPARDSTEDRLLNRMRRVAVGVMLLMVVLLVIASVAGLHASELMFGTLVGAILMLLGIESISKLPSLRR